MATLPDKAFDLAIVDPPYGISGKDGKIKKMIDWGTNTRLHHLDKTWDTNIPNADYFIELFRVSKDQIIWGGNYFINYLYASRGIIAWDKMNGTNDASDFEFAWTSFNVPARMFRHHHFSGVGTFHYTSIHPTQKSVAIYKWLLKNYATPDMRIIDTHLGSGSSAIAAYDFGCEFVGCEIDADYYAAALKRFNIHKMQTKLF
jgi:site-specific DNA-methyltransferase (adenine-specific)